MGSGFRRKGLQGKEFIFPACGGFGEKKLTPARFFAIIPRMTKPAADSRPQEDTPDRPSAEIVAILASIDKQHASIDKQHASIDKQHASIDQLRGSIDQLRASIAEVNATIARREKLAEADRQEARKRDKEARDLAEKNRADLDKKISDEVKRAEGFRDSLARAAEDAFAFRLKDILRDNYGLQLDEVLRRVQVVNHGSEVDILGLNGSVAVVGEVKIRVQRDDVHKFADKLRDFREDFPDHARETVYGVVAGETVDDDAAAIARKRGFFVLRMDEGIVCPETPKNFRPRAY